MLYPGAVLVIFICSGLLVYWIVRTYQLLTGQNEEIEEVLECDLWWGRRFLHALRSAFDPPQHLVG